MAVKTLFLPTTYPLREWNADFSINATRITFATMALGCHICPSPPLYEQVYTYTHSTSSFGETRHQWQACQLPNNTTHFIIQNDSYKNIAYKHQLAILQLSHIYTQDCSVGSYQLQSCIYNTHTEHTGPLTLTFYCFLILAQRENLFMCIC